MISSTGQLTRQVDLWTRQTLAFGGFLVHLYRRLQDEKQAATALEVMAPSQERAARLGLAPVEPLDRDPPDETEAEARAWQGLVEAQMGFCSFHAMVDGPRGPRRRAERAYRAAVRGFVTAFPVEWVAERWEAILDQVSTRCADGFIQDLGEDGDPEDRAELHRLIRSNLHQGFTRAWAEQQAPAAGPGDVNYQPAEPLGARP
ncbi:hypothetical protein [Mesoterricola silvestris]|uniref:Uncharacterized protein n=1 Tax=Mesoterricola silvestris TaxID=2927979 RepID=A0AA48H9A9_9BACT|nr:hypothetical protein [Mesoterricola silvestris]BDU74148.1 hypothetical protein METEAL_33220 [Mesoterricola silvestris]